MRVLDLFSAAAGGWSLGLHRAGFTTVAACEVIAWRRDLYAQNNPGVRLYDDVRTLTGARLERDLGALPDTVVGSPPCQDISSANTKGRGVDGEHSGLFFEAIRIIGEVRPRWFALENSDRVRTRGYDRIATALEDLDYGCWPLVVGVGNAGGSHKRKRAWLIGMDANAPFSQGRLAGQPRLDADAGCPGGQQEGRRGTGGGGSAARKRVEELAILWAPTPTATNYGSNVALGPDGARTGKKRSSLASLASSVGLSGRLILAAIYEHMMGYPVGWLSNAARRTATPSAPKSPKP